MELTRVQLLRLCHKRHWDVPFVLSLGALAPRGVSCQTVKTLKQTYEESHTASCWISLPTVIRVSYLGTAVLVKPSDDYRSDQHLTATSEETLSKVIQLSHSWKNDLQISKNNKCVFIIAARFGQYMIFKAEAWKMRS